MSRVLLLAPIYNCEKQIVRVLRQLKPEVCRELTEVTVVNDQSTGNSETAAMRYLGEHPLPIPVTLLRDGDNYSLGGSHKVTFEYTMKHNFDCVIVLHGDGQGDIANILPHLQNGAYRKYDYFLGARFMHGSKLWGCSAFRAFDNHAYNPLFSIGTGRRIYDLGSRLNVCEVSSLKSRFYKRRKGNLMFDYCMILGSSCYRQNMRFLPIPWRKDDQISNVKMVNQAIVVLEPLGSYIVNRKGFIAAGHRGKLIPAYTTKPVYTNRRGKKNDDHETESI